MRDQQDRLIIAIIGASGFVGRAVVNAVRAAGHDPIALPAPRLTSTSTSVSDLVAEAQAFDATELRKLAGDGSSASLAINAAGLAIPGARNTPALNGANALLPPVLARVGEEAGWRRLVHVSSAAVYGYEPLNEGVEPRPSSPYASSKLMGDHALELMSEALALHTVILRPTSVHGPDRKTTRTMTMLARSPLASVAGAGDRPTPQVGVRNVAAACVFLATCEKPPSFPVIQPWEGVTTAGLLRSIGGREPHHVPMRVAHVVLGVTRVAGHLQPQVRSAARRLEMLWLGQEQPAGWLDSVGWVPPHLWPDGIN